MIGIILITIAYGDNNEAKDDANIVQTHSSRL